MDKENVKVLVVDDDSFVRDMLGMILETNGYAVDTADNGSAALGKYADNQDIGLVISDMNMPEMTGLELIRELRKKESDVPVIILTGNNEISVAIEAMNSGANDYLLKDENIQDTIVLSAQKVLEKYNLKKQNLQLMADLALKNERLEKDRLLAQKVQASILPSQLDFKGFEIGTFYRPSDKIGGDFFDAWESQDCVHFLMGDVSGHSTSSALIMAVCKGMLQSLGYMRTDPVGIVGMANRMLCGIVGDTGMFLSLIYGIFDRKNDEVRILSAGHTPVFVFSRGGVRSVESTGPVLGWDPEDTWSVVSFGLDRGDRLFLYTDGLTEAKDKSGEEFGEARLLELQKGGESPKDLIDKIFREVNGFCGGDFLDDLTMFVIGRSGDNG